jgi:hypothetical protein
VHSTFAQLESLDILGTSDMLDFDSPLEFTAMWMDKKASDTERMLLGGFFDIVSRLSRSPDQIGRPRVSSVVELSQPDGRSNAVRRREHSLVPVLPPVGGSRDGGRASDGGWIEMQSIGGRAPESTGGGLQEFVDLDLPDIRRIRAASLEGRDEEEGWDAEVGGMADMPSAPPVQDEEDMLTLPEVSELAEETVSSSAAVKRKSLAEFESGAEGLPGMDLPPVPSPNRHWKKMSSLVQEDGGSQLLKTARFGPVSANIQQRASNK